MKWSLAAAITIAGARDTRTEKVAAMICYYDGINGTVDDGIDGTVDDGIDGTVESN